MNTRHILIKALLSHSQSHYNERGFVLRGIALARAMGDLLTACTEGSLGMNREQRELFAKEFHKQYDDWVKFYPRGKTTEDQPILIDNNDPQGIILDRAIMLSEALGGFHETPVDEHGTPGIRSDFSLRIPQKTDDPNDDMFVIPQGSLRGREILRPGQKKPSCPCHGSAGFDNLLETSTEEEYQKLLKKQRQEEDEWWHEYGARWIEHSVRGARFAGHRPYKQTSDEEPAEEAAEWGSYQRWKPPAEKKGLCVCGTVWGKSACPICQPEESE